MPRMTAGRLIVALAAVVVLGLGAAMDARGENTPPTLELLSPAPGGTMVISREQQKWPVYKVRVTFPADYSNIYLVSLETALDAAFTRDRSRDNKMCPTGTAVCELSFSAQSLYAPGTRVYWRVSIPDLIVSPVRSWVAVGATVADRDRDGIPDAKDNCPLSGTRSSPTSTLTGGAMPVSRIPARLVSRHTAVGRGAVSTPSFSGGRSTTARSRSVLS